MRISTHPPLFNYKMIGLFDSGPIDGGADAQDGSTELELVGTDKFGSNVHTDTFGRVVNLGVAPSLVFLVVFHALNYYYLVDVHIAEALVRVLHVLTLVAVGIGALNNFSV